MVFPCFMRYVKLAGSIESRPKSLNMMLVIGTLRINLLTRATISVILSFPQFIFATMPFIKILNTVSKDRMWMEAEQGFDSIFNFLIKNPVKIFEITGGYYILPNQAYVCLRASD